MKVDKTKVYGLVASCYGPQGGFFPQPALLASQVWGRSWRVVFERLCGLEEPLKRGMRIGKSCRLGLYTTTHVQPLYVRPLCVHWRDTREVSRCGGVRDLPILVMCEHHPSWTRSVFFKYGDRGQEAGAMLLKLCVQTQKRPKIGRRSGV